MALNVLLDQTDLMDINKTFRSKIEKYSFSQIDMEHFPDKPLIRPQNKSQ